jgi:hypothetical protein
VGRVFGLFGEHGVQIIDGINRRGRNVVRRREDLIPMPEEGKRWKESDQEDYRNADLVGEDPAERAGPLNSVHLFGA